MPYVEDALGSVVVVIEVLRAQGLIAKDRSLLRQKTSSDPYVKIYYQDKEIGRTRVISKDLDPVWTEKFDLTLDADDRILREKVHLTFGIFDHDVVSADDAMGSVDVELNLLEPQTVGWYKVTTGYGKTHCDNATGKIELAMSVSARTVPALVSGNRFGLSDCPFKVAVSWEALNDVTVETTCAAINLECWGKIGLLALDQTISPHQIITDKQVGSYSKTSVYNELFTFRAPTYSPVPVIYFVMSVTSPLGSLDSVSGIRLRVFPDQQETAACEYRPRGSRNGSTLVLARLWQHQQGMWVFAPIGDIYKDVCDYGSLAPELKSYSRDIGPDIVLFPDRERMAVMEKDNSIDIADHSPGRELPEWVALGVGWQHRDGLEESDLDLSAICLGEELNELEIISFRQLISRDYSVKHGGDSRLDKRGYDEVIQLSLESISEHIKYIGIVVNSYTGQLLDNFTFLCRLFDCTPAENDEPCHQHRSIAHYCRPEGGNGTALILACFCRSEEGWKFRTIGEPALGNVGHENIDELQEILNHTTPLLSLAIPPNPATVENEMPPPMPTKPVDEKIAIPAFEFMKYILCQDETT